MLNQMDKINLFAMIIYCFSCFCLGFTVSLCGITLFTLQYWLILLIVSTIIIALLVMTRRVHHG